MIDRTDLLFEQCSTVTVPEQVWSELYRGNEIPSVLENARSQEMIRVVPVEPDELYAELRRELDEGETAAITLAIRRQADLLLIDEREGRKTARRHGIAVTGVIGVLIRAADDGLIDFPTELDALRTAGFWILGELYSAVIRRYEQTDT